VGDPQSRLFLAEGATSQARRDRQLHFKPTVVRARSRTLQAVGPTDVSNNHVLLSSLYPQHSHSRSLVSETYLIMLNPTNAGQCVSNSPHSGFARPTSPIAAQGCNTQSNCGGYGGVCFPAVYVLLFGTGATPVRALWICWDV